jgi:peptide/nickel transport system substrate-binding protein
VREAAEYAIDKEGIVSSIFFGLAQAGYQACWADQTLYDPNFQGRRYDVAKAKALLAEAGYADGFKTTLYCAVQVNGNFLPVIQANLKAVGIDCDVQIVTVAKWIDLETNGWDDGILVSPGDADQTWPENVGRFWMRPTTPNWVAGLYWTTLYRPPEMDALVRQCLTSPILDQENAAGLALIKLMYDQCVEIPLWQIKGGIVLKDNVHDLQFRKSMVAGDWNFTGTWLSK